MGEVVSIYTDQPVTLEPQLKRDDTVEIIESLYQRRYQIKSIVIGGIEQRTGEPIFGYSYLDHDELERMQVSLNRQINKELADYGLDLSDD